MVRVCAHTYIYTPRTAPNAVVVRVFVRIQCFVCGVQADEDMSNDTAQLASLGGPGEKPIDNPLYQAVLGGVLQGACAPRAPAARRRILAGWRL